MEQIEIAQLSDEELAQRMALLDLIEIVENDGRDGSVVDIEQLSKNLDEELRRRTAELLADRAFSHDAAIEVMEHMAADGLDEWSGPSVRELAARLTNMQLRQRLDECLRLIRGQRWAASRGITFELPPLHRSQTPEQMKQKLLQHYATKRPTLFKQYDGFDGGDDVMHPDEDGHCMTFCRTMELMDTAPEVRVLIPTGVTRETAAALLRKIAAMILEFESDFVIENKSADPTDPF